MAETLIQPFIEKIMDYLADPLKKQVSYLCCYSCNVETFLDEVGELNIKYESVQQDVNSARANCGVIRPEVEAWLRKVDELKSRSDGIRGDVEEIQRGSVCKWLPLVHYSLSRKAFKIAKDSVELGNIKFDRIFNPLILAEIPPVPTTSTSSVGFESRNFVENRIMDALKDPSVYSIGIWGIGGVGKTVMAKKIEEKVRDDKSLFEHVVMVVVSQQPVISKIQSQIAEGLGLTLTEESPIFRQRKVHQRLMAEKSILIILDDLWESLDLEEFGIPSQTTHTHCKLILTSRDRDVLTSTGVLVRNIFPLETLTEEESWRFFRDNAGINIDDDNSHNELVQIAKKVEGECKGLPLALKIVASALKGKDISFWDNAVRELQKSVPDNIPGVSKGVYGPLLYSIKALEGNEQKNLFLLCCLFPEDYSISIEELLRCGVGLRIFKGLENLIAVRDKVKTVLKILTSRSLLIEDGGYLDNFEVRMHDVIRDVGIWITNQEGMIGSNKGKHLFMISHGLNEWPFTMEEDYTCISLLFSNHNITFPESIVCPKLEFLRLDFVPRNYIIYKQRNYRAELPHNFFNGIGTLKVLEGLRIGFIPLSIGQLNCLCTLFLQECKILETIEVLGKLINLEILTLDNCEFEMLPMNVGSLKNLKHVNIINCKSLITIAFGVISGLIKLEELVILGSFDNWEAKDGEKDVASLSELNGLKHLITLKIEIKNSSVVPREKPLWVQKVKKYNISVSKCSFDSESERHQKVILLGKEVVNPLGNWIYDMASDAEYLNLEGSNCITILNGLSKNVGNLSCLKELRLSDFTDIRNLGDGLQKGAIFLMLESLDIRNSVSLQQILEVSPPIGSFVALKTISFRNLSRFICLWKVSVKEQLYLKNLQKIRIMNCDNLSYIFSLSVAQSLVQIIELEVDSCEAMKEIFKKDDGELVEINKIELPKLWFLSFKNLKSFCHFCNGIDRIELPKLRVLNLCDLPSMKMTEGGNEVYERYLIPKFAGMNFSFCGLTALEVEGFGNLKCMFSPSVISGVPNLHELYIKNCSMLEQVIGKDDEIVGETILFPKLHTLILENLPNILTFCYNAIQLPSLEWVKIEECPLMMKFVEELPNHISNSTPFFNEQVAGMNFNFCGLTKLDVEGFGNFKCMFSPSVISGVPNLRELYIKNCSMLEQVIGKDDEIVGEAILFPKLYQLSLENLPNILTFCYNAIQLPSLEWVTIEECPLMMKFVEELPNHISNSTPFFNEQVQCPKLRSLDMVGLNISAVFTLLSFESVTNLEYLYLTRCEELEHVISKDGQSTTNMEEEFIQSIPLKRLDLIKLPKLYGSVFQMKQHLEFASLEYIRIQDCPMLEKFCIGSLHLPRLKRVEGFLNHEFADNFFFHNEISSREIHSDNNCFIISVKDISFNSNINEYFLTPSSSGGSIVDAIELPLHNARKKIVGKFKTKKILTGIVYEIMLMIMVMDDYNWEDSIEIELKIFGEIELQQSSRTEILGKKELNTWTELSIGKFMTRESQQINQEFEFSLRQLESSVDPWNQYRRLAIKGVRILEV